MYCLSERGDAQLVIVRDDLMRLPAFLSEVLDDRHARGALLAGSAALFAAGLDPRVWSAALRSVQVAVRLEPQLEAIIVVAAVAEAGLLLLGGAIGDWARARPIVLGGLVVELVTALVGLVVPDDGLFVLTRIIGLAAAAFVIPVALAAVATSYNGTARATAIGFAYAAYGAATALGPILLEVVPSAQWPAFVAAATACVLAIWLVGRRLPDLHRPTVVERPYVLATALWGFGIVVLTTAIIWFGSGWDDPLRWALILTGAATIGAAATYERRRRRVAPGMRVDRRPVAV
ncbi:MAG: MFS transporter, partial [Candidatus Limnocylindrales bacterium]